MSGTLQLGGTNLAVHSGSGASAKITLDSGLVFPAGHIIQYKRKEDTTSGSFNLTGAGSTTAQATGLSESIACLSGSKLIISVEVLFVVNDPQYDSYYYIYKDNGSGSYAQVSTASNDWEFHRTSDNVQTYMRACFSVIDNSPSTDLITYKLYARTNNTSNYFRTYQTAGNPGVMTLMEIAQ